MDKKRPIFVLGLQRSGTTWLANMLSSHPCIAAVEADDHQGVHESIFFSHFAKGFGDFNHPKSKARFFENFLESDYGILSEVQPDFLEKNEDIDSYYAFFRAVMDDVARKKGSSNWLEKSPHHTLMADELRLAYPDARFICVLRSDEELIPSRLSGFGRTPPSGFKRMSKIIRACAVNAMNHRYIKKLGGKDAQTIVLQYSDLKKQTEQNMKSILNFLGLDWTDEVLVMRYKPNSSFAKVRHENSSLTVIDQIVIKFARFFFNIVPLKLLLKIEDKMNKDRGIDWPDWCWKRVGRLAPKD
ncbi:sulfotransferase family protein [Neptuniibacter sp. QD72_48]|uniref:sulfotransferase family protein n=1 Tax=unclassified Neptuniibacter TaxID=2630693 RepID=UPI0039F57922